MFLAMPPQVAPCASAFARAVDDAPSERRRRSSLSGGDCAPDLPKLDDLCTGGHFSGRFRHGFPAISVPKKNLSLQAKLGAQGY